MKKMKKTITRIFILLFAPTSILFGQDYTFESDVISSDWTASNGTLSVSTEHYKEGSQSLQWTTAGKSQLIVTLPSLLTINATNSAYMDLYIPSATNDTLVVEFILNGTTVWRTANFLCNTRGWREFNRAYNEYASTSNRQISSLRFTLKPTDDAPRKLFFDDVHLNQPTQTGRVPGTHWVLDRSYLTQNTDQSDYTKGFGRALRTYANAVNSTELPITEPTVQELNDLNNLRIAQKQHLTPTYNADQARLARDYVTTLNIVRNSDGTLSGKVIDTTVSGLTFESVVTILQRLGYLAGAIETTGAEDMKTAFSDYLEHLFDQGFSEGCNILYYCNAYTAPQTVIPLLLTIIPTCTGNQREEIIKLARWISFYDTMYEPESDYLGSINSDIIYLYLSYMQTIAMFHGEDALAVRELKAVKRFMERSTEYVPGSNDMFKPDGTGFHHNTHYNNYMYAYQPFLAGIYTFKGTEFRLSEEAYERFKKAILAIYTMATLSTNDTRHYAHTFSGRNPFGLGGMNVYFSKNEFEKLVEIGGDCMGTDIDEELAGAYNYFFQSGNYAVAPNVYEGFYAFNYSPAAIFRQNNWVATMHAPTTNLWGSEIYSGTNRFGRYQSHGVLEITYGNGTLAASGYPTNTGGGWDWNVIPGTTTVHYTTWQDMMPGKNTTDRFDQFTNTKNFSGGLSFGDCGVFTTDFDQIDTWSNSSRFTPTNLVFKKSMFAFENMIISLGSDIGSSGTYSTNWITATNLFQEIISSEDAPLLHNGNTLRNPYQSTIPSTANNWLITPLGTGYYIPRANDDIVIFYDSQTTPDHSGSDYASPISTSKAAKAYLKHGIKPASAGYVFVVVPAATQEVMEDLATHIGDNGGDVFTIESQSTAMHALTYKPLHITAYSFFTAVNAIPFGIVESTSSKHLLMDKLDPQTGRHEFAVSNPNLNPQTNSVFGWITQPTETTITLKGEWLPVENTPGVAFSPPAGGTTTVTVTMNDGNAVYFAVKTMDDTKITAVNSSPQWFGLLKTENQLDLQFSEPLTEHVQIAIYTANGTLVYKQEHKAGSQHVSIPLGQLPKGVLVCVVSDTKKTESQKFIR
ncbi:MAG: hypothetical protein LBN93_05740 [Candidatus Symbiothrix sp.]|jgi:hypothetical protein|nr:hypothetical protein [Candidatus Symbiothrix sp.]